MKKHIFTSVLALLVVSLVVTLTPLNAASKNRGRKWRTTTTTSTTVATTTTTSTPSSTTTSPVATTTTTPGPVVGADALQRRVLAELREFTTWLRGHKGYVGEVGWPNNADTTKWNSLADTWYKEADYANLIVNAWAAGEWWGSYPLNLYATANGSYGTLIKPLSGAWVVEAHLLGSAAKDRGVNFNGAEFGIGGNLGTGTGGRFSNVNRGVYDTDYWYNTKESLAYLASRGIEVIRQPVRWERIQPALGGSLDSVELTRLRTLIADANSVGIQVIPTIFNYGAYWLHDYVTNSGKRTPIGSLQVTEAHYVDLWKRLVLALSSNSNILAWGLMNEPVSITSGAAGWEHASQAAVDGIRSTGDIRSIAVPTYNWSSIPEVLETHPNGPWVNDPINKIIYEAHHYFDRDNSGSYARSYDSEVSDAIARGY